MDSASISILHKICTVKFASGTDPLTVKVIDTMLNDENLLESLSMLPRAHRIIWQCGSCPSLSDGASMRSAKRTTSFLRYPVPLPGTDGELTSARRVFRSSALLMTRVLKMTGFNPLPSLFFLPGVHLNKTTQPGYMIWSLLDYSFLQYSIEQVRAVMTVGVVDSDREDEHLMFGYSKYEKVSMTFSSETLKDALFNGHAVPKLESALEDAISMSSEVKALLDV